MINAATHWKAMIAATGFMVALLASPASAQRADDMRGGGQNPCAPDAQRICSAFIPDRAKVASCLFKNKRQLSSACRAELGGGSGKKAGKAKRGGRYHGRRHRRHH
jgi:hypothetical protein